MVIPKGTRRQETDEREASDDRSGAATHPPFPHRHPKEIQELLPRHFERVWRTAHRFGFDAREAEEAAQQAFTVLASRIREIAPGREVPFLVGVVAHLAANAHRRRYRQREILAEEFIAQCHDPDANPEELVARRHARVQLEGILNRLPQSHREVFVLFELEEMPMQEIAAALSMPVGTVATRLRRGRVLFQREVNRLRSRQATVDRMWGGE
ncbi:MAG: sigma-70 family RNA polymerase sigma factor [Polyangiaceae bacterium]|nr:sigma-70 family RNA polymerase sigma factor [Polyangiaceae bacterium]